MSSKQKIYSELGIMIATFFGGFFAGGYVISKNYKRMGEVAKAKLSFWLGVIGTILFFTVMHFVPAEKWGIPNTIYYIPQVIIVGIILEQTQKKQIKQHISEDGEFESNWKAFGIATLCLAIALILLIATYMVLGIEP